MIKACIYFTLVFCCLVVANFALTKASNEEKVKKEMIRPAAELMRMTAGENSGKRTEFLIEEMKKEEKEEVEGIKENENDKQPDETEENVEEKTEERVKEVRKPENVRAIYLTASMTASKSLDKQIDALIESKGNAVVIDIEIGGGQLAFQPKNETLKEINPGSTMLNNFPEIIKKLHERNIYVIARQVVFNDPYTSTRKPEWRIKYRWYDGYYDYRWLDPSKPGVQNYNLMIMQEAADLGFDEIQFDYIRFPAANHASLDYHFDEENFEYHEIITDFLKKARKVADEKGVKLGVDVFGAIVWGDVDWKVVGQSVADIAEYVDVIYPMTYPSHYSPGFHGIYNMYYAPYDIVHDSIERFVERANGKAEIRPWIQGFPLKAQNFGPKYIADQIQAGYDAGALGFSIWSPGNVYTHSWAEMGMIPTPKPKEESKEDVNNEVMTESETSNE